ncbi:unnamed protein product [Rotaria magnacalcarata]|uniref:CCHC-type domain-containing protein n=1 Tax=Rotaria magnacalcarata TaxID=392030 RepID=A0A8S2LE36_9BILA|nr:unnamed protein product [Rotaria magnacalcarata]
MQTGLRCYKCRELGHIARFCKKTISNTYYEKASRCNRCNLYGHMEPDCGEYFTQSIQCYRCQRFGHIARNCRTLSDGSQSKNTNHSARNYQYSTDSRQTVCQSLNSVALGAAQQYASRTARVSSARIVQQGQSGLRQQKAVPTFLHSTSNKNSTTTKLEALANELLFTLFEYLSTVHLVNAFHGLNARIDALLVVHCRTYYLDFRSVSKPDMSHYFRLNQLALLVKKTPHLRSMCIRHHDIDDDNDYLSSPLLSVTVSKLFSLRSRPVMMNLLQNMPNLKNLTVETFYLNLDGYQWEKIIVQYLFKLRIFRLKMHIQLTGIKNNEQQLDTLFTSFRSQFWIEQRRCSTPQPMMFLLDSSLNTRRTNVLFSGILENNLIVYFEKLIDGKLRKAVPTDFQLKPLSVCRARGCRMFYDFKVALPDDKFAKASLNSHAGYVMGNDLNINIESIVCFF